MPDYKTLYFNLFNNVSDAIERLKQAQQEAEEQYLSQAPCCDITVVKKSPNQLKQKK